MRLKTFRAATMADALAQVKKDLGKDAVILHTRSYKAGAIFGFGGRPTVEITASVDVNTPPRARARQEQAELVGAAAGVGGGAGGVGGGGSRVNPSALGRAYGLGAAGAVLPPLSAGGAAGGGGEALRSREASVVASPVVVAAPVAAAAQPAHLAPAPGLAGPDSDLRAELLAIKRMVGQVLQSAPGVATIAAPPMPRTLVDHYMKLIEGDVSREIADDITARVRDELSPQELSEEAIVRQAMIRHIEALLPETDTPLPGRPPDNRPFTIALIGPTGVGKTTTVAKLAAAYKLRHGKKVGLITADTYRIAAVEQLRTYANIIGVPLKVVMSPAEMAAACDDLCDMDAVLIDTAGRSPSDSPRLAELGEYLQAARPHQRHMVLSSVLGDAAMLRAVERYQSLKPDHLIFTKLDEAASYGVLLNIAGRLEARISYITTGQEVPDDIEPGRTDRLARLILDGAMRN